ncbi:hypothetical protein [Celeribacter sp.]|uniref:hypothetical protein n=1 Tax=Celeribacter sp. TaxID=1890673 RepID=UPI003A90DB86
MTVVFTVAFVALAPTRATAQPERLAITLVITRAATTAVRVLRKITDQNQP